MTPRSLPLSSQVFAILSGLIEDRLGLFYAWSDAELLAERVSPRALELGFDSLLDYYYYLRYDAGAEAELVQLADALVVNETYFTREADQLKALAEQLIPRLLLDRRKVRVWSAACSTGEEPLTLGGMLLEAGVLERVEIVATDISSRALAVARAGRYAGRSLRTVSEAPPSWLLIEGRFARVKQEVADAVTWQRLNLIDMAAVASLGRFDVIICRNVLIYFRDATIKTLTSVFESALNPGGYLLVGASESLLRFGGSLECEEHGGAFFYRKATR
jgi:chemotaxis protein methyltransferase CheR